jgi:hypothetical protein
MHAAGPAPDGKHQTAAVIKDGAVGRSRVLTVAGAMALAVAGWAVWPQRGESLPEKSAPPRAARAAVARPVDHTGRRLSRQETADAAEVQRKLRRFAAASVPLRSVPLSQALSWLEAQWKSYPHRDPEISGAVAFTLSSAARARWPAPTDEPRGSLEIPGISLLTSIEIIAAQAGLRVKVSGTGVCLVPDSTRDDGQERTWSLPFPTAAFRAFLERTRDGSGQPAPLFTLSWLETPEVDIGFTIDLDQIDLDQIEFEGFINYGSPIQTTGVNALGQSEPVILTDSKITQPVFATRDLSEPPPELPWLLAAHGTAPVLLRDAANGTLSFTGTLAQLRTANAVLLAIAEAAAAGVTAEMRVIEWPDGTAPPAVDTVRLSGSEAAKLLRLPGARLTATVKRTVPLTAPFDLIPQAAGNTEADSHLPPGRITAKIKDTLASGFSWKADVSLVRDAPAPGGAADVPGLEDAAAEPKRLSLALQDGEWARVDLPAREDSPAATVLLSLRPGSVTLD